LNSRWALDGFHADQEAIDNNVILNDLVATKHYPQKEVDTHEFIKDLGKWKIETDEAAKRVQQAEQDNRFRKSFNQIKTDFGMEIHNIEGSE
jgi:hypothetical protein